MAGLPKAIAVAAMNCCVDMCSDAAPSWVMTYCRPLKRPLESYAWIPRVFRPSVACLVGLDMLTSADRSAVPAVSPMTPDLPSRPTAVAVSWSEMPALWAIGPTYFMA